MTINRDNLPSTENYVIIIKDDEDNGEVYAVVNKETNVVEYQDTILSRTYFALLNIEENHERMVKDMNGEDLIEVPTPANGEVKLVN